MEVVQPDLPFEPGEWATQRPQRRRTYGAIPSAGSWQVTAGSSMFPSVMFNQKTTGSASYTSANSILNG